MGATKVQDDQISMGSIFSREAARTTALLSPALYALVRVPLQPALRARDFVCFWIAATPLSKVDNMYLWLRSKPPNIRPDTSAECMSQPQPRSYQYQHSRVTLDFVGRTAASCERN